MAQQQFIQALDGVSIPEAIEYINQWLKANNAAHLTHAYKEGCRDTRHDAAELAAYAGNSELHSEIMNLRPRHARARRTHS